MTLESDSILRREIGEQPEVVARLLERGHLSLPRPPFILIAARGSSDNAARYAQYAFGIAAGIPVALAAPSLTTLYRAKLRVKGALVLGISQSGRSPDVVETVAAARRAGARTLAIVNDTASPLARAAHDVVPLGAGPERSVAATKSYVAQLTAVAMLAAAFGSKRGAFAALPRIPDAIELALRSEERAMESAITLRDAARAAVLGRGVHVATAHEIALKLKELALLPAEPASSADFRHGPIAMADASLQAIVVDPPGCAAGAELRTLARALRARGCGVLRLGSRELPVPRLPEILSPIVAVVPGQLLALHAARARGCDPDAPRGLRKVTKTR